MKKLMIAAVVAAVAGATFANCNYDEPDQPTGTAWAYNWRFLGKSTVGDPRVLPGIPTGGTCDYGEGVKSGECIRVPATLDIQGYTYKCDPVCTSDEMSDMINLADHIAEFVMLKPYELSVSAKPEFNATTAWAIGVYGQYFELGGTVKFEFAFDAAGEYTQTYDLTFAGMGNYGVYGSMKLPGTVQGTFAGSLDKPYYVSKTLCCGAVPYNCMRTGFLDATLPSVAYGNWACKFNANVAISYNLYGKKAKMPKWYRKVAE